NSIAATRRRDAMAFGVPGQTEDNNLAAGRLQMAAELGAHFAGLRVPDLHDALEAGARSNAQAARGVGAERHTADFTAVLEGRSFLALVGSERGPIPDAYSPVEAGRSEAVAVRAER